MENTYLYILLLLIYPVNVFLGQKNTINTNDFCFKRFLEFLKINIIRQNIKNNSL